MSEQQRNAFFKAYLIHCLDISSQDMTEEKRSKMLKNLHTIHETHDITEVFEAIRS